jgi:murein tripeptide amidase MpaA
MKKLLLILMIGFSQIALSQEVKYSKAKIYYNNQEEYNKLIKHEVTLDHVKHKKNVFVEGDFSSNDINIAKSLGCKIEILIDDVQQYYIKRNQSGIQNIKAKNNSCSNNLNPTYANPINYNHGSMGGFLTYNQVMSEIDSMALLYPDLITLRSPISTFTTFEGRNLYWVKISDNPNINENEPEILYDAVHHAREPMSVHQLIFYMWYLLENYTSNPEVQTIINNTELYFVPFVNPDGFIYNEITYPNGGGMWRKNRRDHSNGDYGVDNNRNYNYIDAANGSVWGTNGISFNTNSAVYCGLNAFSEPENQAMKWFIEQHEFKIVLNNHSYSDLLLYPFGFDINRYTPDHNTYFAISDLMTSSNNMDSQLGWELYPAAGNSDDFMYGDTVNHSKIFSFTPEIGSGMQGFWPVFTDIDPLCKSMMPLNLTAAHLVGNYAEVTDRNTFSISNINGFILYDLTRYGLQTPANFTVSLLPISNNIQNVGTPNTHNNMSILQSDFDSISYILTNNISQGDLVEYVISVNNGAYSFNDTIIKVYGNTTLLLSDNCNNTIGWNTQSSWGTTNITYHSSSSSITDSPLSNYSDNIDNSITLSNPVSLNNSIAAYLTFWGKWAIDDNWDYVQFEISTDNGITWIPQCGNYTEEGTIDQDLGQPVYDGMQDIWVKETIDLSNFLGENILFRFQIVSDGWNTADGFYFDDLEIHAIYNSGCTDLLACNYNPIATIDDSSCNYHTIIYDTIIANNSYNWQSTILTISGNYIDTLLNSVGCDSIINLYLTITNYTGIFNIKNTERKLLKITDVLGRKTPYRKKIPLFYIYDDGTVEKRIVIE